MNKLTKLLLALLIAWLAIGALMSYIYFNVNSSKVNQVYQLKGGVFNKFEIKNLPITAGRFVWFANHSTYYTYGEESYVLRVNNKWDPTEITGITDFDNKYVWDGGIDIYYSNGSEQYILDDDKWKEKEWNIDNIDGSQIWSNGYKIYYSNGYEHYTLNGKNWKPVNWNLELYGENVWTDSKGNVYYSNGTTHYYLNRNKWEVKDWNGLDNFYGKYIWTVDKDFTFYSYGNEQYSLSGDTWTPKQWNLTSFNGNDVWKDSKENVYYYGYNAKSIEEAEKSYVIKKSVIEGLSWPKFVIDTVSNILNK